MRAQNAVEHRRGGAFAVGAGDVYERERGLRRADRLREQAHPVDSEFTAVISERA